MGLWGEQVSRTCLGPGSPSPRGPSRSGAHSGSAALWPGLPEATLLWRLPPSLPPGPRLSKAPAQGWSEFRQIPLPLLPNISRTCPPPWKPAPPGARGFFPSPPTPHLPAAPMVPRHPTSRTEPASLAPACPAAQRTPHLSHRQEVPKPPFPGGNRQTPPDQHLAHPAAALPGPPGPFPRPSHTDPRLSLGNLRAVVSEKCETQTYLEISCGPPLMSLRIASHGTDGGEEAPLEQGAGEQS